MNAPAIIKFGFKSQLDRVRSIAWAAQEKARAFPVAEPERPVKQCFQAAPDDVSLRALQDSGPIDGWSVCTSVAHRRHEVIVHGLQRQFMFGLFLAKDLENFLALRIFHPF